jgi:predicted Zn-dependent peptidase
VRTFFPSGGLRTRLIPPIAAALFILVLSAYSPQADAFDPAAGIHRTILPNGIRVLVKERSISPTVSLYIRHRAGAVDDLTSRTGAAHLLEHMMFKGTTTIGTVDYQAEKSLRDRISEARSVLKKVSRRDGDDSSEARELAEKINRLEEEKRSLIVSNEIDRLYRERGGVGLNASTGYELTTYMVNLPANALELWARIEADRLMNPVFREFLSERDVVREERRQMVDSRPERQLSELFLGTAFIAHPYGRPILGWSDDIARLDIDYLTRFFRSLYRPSNMVIAVVGDVTNSEVLPLITKYFGALKESPADNLLTRGVTAEPPQRGERRASLSSSANPRLIIGFKKPTAPAMEDYVFDIIENILTGGRSSRLYRSLVIEKELAGDISAVNGFPGILYNNLFIVEAEPLDGVSLAALESAILSELERLKREPVSRRELQKAKNGIRADFCRMLDSNSGTASVLSYFEATLGDCGYLTNYLDRIASIEADDIRSAADEYFVKSNRTVALLEREEHP